MAVTPAVSVVMPVFERAAVLPDAVRSVLAQTMGNIELVIVDDGSSIDLAVELGCFDDTRVRWIRHERNLGVAAARNTGIREARAAHVAFLDSDDRWRANKLERQFTTLNEAGRDACGCCTGFALYRPTRDAPEISRERNHVDWFSHLMWGCNLSLGSTLLVERSSFEQVGFFDERFGRFEDWDWALRFVQKRRLILTPETLCDVHVTGPASASDVEAGLHLMYKKHMLTARMHGFKTSRRFRSSLWLERSALAYRSGDFGLAVTRLLRSYAIYPLRNFAFYRQMLHHLVRAVATPQLRRQAATD